MLTHILSLRRAGCEHEKRRRESLTLVHGTFLEVEEIEDAG
jgi:hypothetical protein